MKLRFTKMHGAGNDFVVIDGVRTAVKLSEEQIRTIANRHTGVGCDQVLIIEPPKKTEHAILWNFPVSPKVSTI